MKIMITGVDGYLGWSLAIYLAKRGHAVGGIDNYSRRAWVGESASQSAIPIASMADRLKAFASTFDEPLRFFRGDLTDYDFVCDAYRAFKPDAIVYLGEMPSAPYSMIDVHHAVFTQTNNVIGTLVTLYAMRRQPARRAPGQARDHGRVRHSEHRHPRGFLRDRVPRPHGPTDVPAPRRELVPPVQGPRHQQRRDGLPDLGSAVDRHHAGCRLRHPHRRDGRPEHLRTRFDFDQCFGTAINRFCAQAVIGLPMTPYGKDRQRRGFLPLRDSMQCLTLALENPPNAGEYRVFNQFEETYTITELAEQVQTIARRDRIRRPDPADREPAVELEEHYYNPDHQHLLDLGYRPTHDMEVRRSERSSKTSGPTPTASQNAGTRTFPTSRGQANAAARRISTTSETRQCQDHADRRSDWSRPSDSRSLPSIPNRQPQALRFRVRFVGRRHALDGVVVPGSVSILRDMLALEQTQFSRLIAILIVATAALWILYLSLRARLSSLDDKFDRLIRATAVRAWIERPEIASSRGGVLVVIPAFNEAENIGHVMGAMPDRPHASPYRSLWSTTGAATRLRNRLEYTGPK